MSANDPIITATLQWRGRTIHITYEPLKWDMLDHVEVISEGREPLPITETGYLSQFFGPVEPSLTIEEVIEIMRDHLDTAATKRAWRNYEADRQQLPLF